MSAYDPKCVAGSLGAETAVAGTRSFKFSAILVRPIVALCQTKGIVADAVGGVGSAGWRLPIRMLLRKSSLSGVRVAFAPMAEDLHDGAQGLAQFGETVVNLGWDLRIDVAVNESVRFQFA